MTTDVTSCAKKSRGRPKVFDRDAALDKAMTLFWQHGYEATSLSDLVEATGAKAPTLYAEFTNKEGLFRAVLDRYISRFAAKHEAQLFCEEKSVEQDEQHHQQPDRIHQRFRAHHDHQRRQKRSIHGNKQARMVADKTDAKTRAIIAFFLDVEFVNGVNQQALYFCHLGPRILQ